MSGDLIQLWDKGVLLQGIWETIYLTFISSFVAYVFGLPIGVLLTVTDKDNPPYPVAQQNNRYFS